MLGDWPGPHTTDLEFTHIQYDARYQRRLRTVWENDDARRANMNGASGKMSHFPERKADCSGIVSHAANVVERPELVSQQIGRFASLVGAENLIAATSSTWWRYSPR